MNITKNQAARILLALSVAGILGGVDQVFAADQPSGAVTVFDENKTISINKDGETGPIKVSKNVTVDYTGGDSKPDYSFVWTEENQTANGTNKQGNLIYTYGNLNITGVNTLGFDTTHTTNKTLDGLLKADSGSVVNISDIDNIKIGSESKVVQADQIFHGYGGQIKVNVKNDFYANVNGAGAIMAQNHDGGHGQVDITAGHDITIHSTKGAVTAGAYYDDTANVNLTAEGKITLTSTVAGRSVIGIKDKYGDSKPGKGGATIQINGKNGVLIEGDNGIYTERLVDAQDGVGSADIQITSDRDVVIKGQSSAVRTNTKGVSATTTIKGSSVQLIAEKPDSQTGVIELKNGNLNINADTAVIKAANGVAANISDKSVLNIGDGNKEATVNIDGRINVSNGGNVNFAYKTTTYVDSKYLKDTAFITTKSAEGGTAGTVTANQGSQFIIKDYKNGDSLIFSDSKDLNQSVSKNDQLKADNVLQKLELSEDGKVTVEKADQADLDKALAGVVLKNVATEAVGNASALKDIFLNGDGTVNVKAANTVANLGELAGLNHGTYTASRLFTDTVGNHLSILPQDKDLWGYYVHSKESVDGLGLAGVAANYDTTYDGAVVGMDLYQKENTAAGVAVSYINGSLEGAGVKNDADYYGLSFYGRKDLANFSLVGDVSYLHGSNTITQTVAGKTFTAKPDVDAFTVGVKALKDVALTDSSKLTPYVGARYLRINTEKYSASNGLTYDADSQDLLIVPVGVDYSADFKHGAWTYRPTVGVGYVWNAAGRSVDQTVSLGDTADSFSYNTVDSSSFIAHVGVTAEKESLSFGVGYEYQDGSSTSADKWYVNAAYRF